MYLINLCLTGAFLILTFAASAQTGPGGVGNAATNVLWLSADDGVYNNTAATVPASDGDNAVVWVDRSGNSKNATHTVASERPNYETGILNGLPVIRFTAANGDRLLSTGLPTSNTASVWAVASWSSLPSSNPGIIQAAPTGLPFSSATTDKVIGMWVSSGAGTNLWGRGVESDNNTIDIPQVTTLSVNTFYSILNLCDGTSISQYVNNGLAGSTGYDGTLKSWSEFGIGRQANEGWNGDIAEVIAYNIAVNSAQRIIVNNYLSAKYNMPLAANDVYTMDNAGSGNFDHEVAGIGRVNALNAHSDARGSGILRVLNPTGLGNNEFLMWGHDNGSMNTTTSAGLPAGITSRFTRLWRVSETGDVGSVDVEFDLTGSTILSALATCDAALALRLLVDTDNDNNFADETPIGGAADMGSNVYRFSGVSTIGNNMRMALAMYNPGFDGPGGVGGTNGSSSLVLWLNAEKVSGANGATITTWDDQSGYGNSFTTGNGAVFNTSGANGYPTFSFNGSTHYFQRPFSSSLTPTSLTILTAANVSSSADYKAVISNRDDPPGNETRGFILYSIPTSNDWSFWNGHASIAWQQTTASTATAGNWAAITATYQAGASGKNLYVNNTVEGTDSHTLHSNTTQPIRVGAGQNEDVPNFFFQGQMGEVILYNTVLNSAQRIIVNNYLAAKYGFTLSSNDIYTRDTPGNGNFDHEVAGIGQVSAGNVHSEAKGSGMVKISNASNLGNNEFLLWGHDNGSLTTTNTTDVPAGIQGRLSRTWSVSETNATGGAVNVGDVDIQFDLSGQGPITSSDLRLLIDADGDGVFNEASTLQISVSASLACNNVLFSAVPGTSLTNGDRFTIGTTNIIQTPLPVELKSFTGDMVDGRSILQWTTATERNTHYFSVERSTDGKNYRAVGRVDAAGTTKEERDYGFEDHFPPFGVVYYRLKQTDLDGAYSYSGIIRLENNAAVTELIVSPNPVSGSEAFKLRVKHFENVDLQQVTVRVFDVVGNDIPVSAETDGDGFLLVRFLNGSASGIYIISASSPDLRQPLTTRVFKK